MGCWHYLLCHCQAGLLYDGVWICPAACWSTGPLCMKAFSRKALVVWWPIEVWGISCVYYCGLLPELTLNVTTASLSTLKVSSQLSCSCSSARHLIVFELVYDNSPKIGGSSISPYCQAQLQVSRVLPSEFSVFVSVTSSIAELQYLHFSSHLWLSIFTSSYTLALLVFSAAFQKFCTACVKSHFAVQCILPLCYNDHKDTWDFHNLTFACLTLTEICLNLEIVFE